MQANSTVFAKIIIIALGQCLSDEFILVITIDIVVILVAIVS
jgi:hypothetical protein